MPWLILGILTAFFESLKDVFSKRSLKNIDEYIVAWSLPIFSIPFLVLLLLLNPLPEIKPPFWIALFCGGTLNTLAVLLYTKAIKSSDLSLTIPIVSFTPLFLTITSPIMIGEYLSLLDFVGILLIITGSYVLNVKEKHKGYLAPFKALWKNKGSKLMLMVALIWSLTSNFDKIGVQNSSPIVWLVALFIFIAVAMFPVILYQSSRNLRQLPQNLLSLLPIGLFNALAVICHMSALNFTLVVHVISLKRTSSLMSVVLGHFIFKEKGIEERLIGSGIMILGVLVIASASLNS